MNDSFEEYPIFGKAKNMFEINKLLRQLKIQISILFEKFLFDILYKKYFFILVSIFIFKSNTIYSAPRDENVNKDSLFTFTFLDIIREESDSIEEDIYNRRTQRLDDMHNAQVDFYYEMSKEEFDYEDEFLFLNTYEAEMSISEIAEICAPIFSFSPDEPNLEKNKVDKIQIPQSFPFERSKIPTVYYQFSSIEGENIVYRPANKKSNSKLNLDNITSFQIDYIHFYPTETGLNEHMFDTEMVEFQIRVIHFRENILGIKKNALCLEKITAKSHAHNRYDNIYRRDNNNREFKLPVTILVEEGKHGSCPDINGDGVYTPGYDVNENVNDAWGVRDVLRSGRLFTPEYQSSMTKDRKNETKIFPPSLLSDTTHKNYSSFYQLKPMPSIKEIDVYYKELFGRYIDFYQNDTHQLNIIFKELIEDQKKLRNDVKAYSKEYWPYNTEKLKFADYFLWFFNSLSYRFDQTQGIAAILPISLEIPLLGGYILPRAYLMFPSQNHFAKYGVNILYTPSSSRFFDHYVSAGYEIATNNLRKDSNYVSLNYSNITIEYGIKLRFNINYGIWPFHYLGAISDLWGLRIGIKGKGNPIKKFDQFNLIFEFGTGLF